MDKINKFYQNTKNSHPDSGLLFACSRVGHNLPKVAIDCGCGSGRNAAYLLSRYFTVYGFDPNPEAIRICEDRFQGESKASFYSDDFISFDYPLASLVLASFSLFFCLENLFDLSWSRITKSIVRGGVFCGTFLGQSDSWAKTGLSSDGLPVLSHSLEEVRSKFAGFTIESLDERSYDGTFLGGEKHWHTITVIAVRNNL